MSQIPGPRASQGRSAAGGAGHLRRNRPRPAAGRARTRTRGPRRRTPLPSLPSWPGRTRSPSTAAAGSGPLTPRSPSPAPASFHMGRRPGRLRDVRHRRARHACHDGPHRSIRSATSPLGCEFASQPFRGRRGRAQITCAVRGCGITRQRACCKAALRAGLLYAVSYRGLAAVRSLPGGSVPSQDRRRGTGLRN